MYNVTNFRTNKIYDSIPTLREAKILCLKHYIGLSKSKYWHVVVYNPYETRDSSYLTIRRTKLE